MKIAKTVTYALMHLIVAISVTYAVTGSLVAAMSVGLVEPAVQTVFYNFHEKLWGTLGNTAAERAMPSADQTAAMPC